MLGLFPTRTIHLDIKAIITGAHYNFITAFELALQDKLSEWVL